jgi:hypothetical protein
MTNLTGEMKSIALANEASHLVERYERGYYGSDP